MLITNWFGNFIVNTNSSESRESQAESPDSLLKETTYGKIPKLIWLGILPHLWDKLYLENSLF